MLTLMKAEKHDSFDHNVTMTNKVIKMLEHDFNKRKIAIVEPFKEKASFAIQIGNIEIWFDKINHEYAISQETHYPGTYEQPPETEIDYLGGYTTFSKALEVAIHTLVTENISAFMEAESEKFFDNLPQVEWQPNDFNSSIPKGVLKHPSCNRQAQL